MDAIGVAARPGFGRIRIGSALTGAVLVVGLVAGLVVGTGAARPAAGPTSPHLPATPAGRIHATGATGAESASPSRLAVYQGLVADIAAAEKSSDHRALIRYSGRLHAMLDAGTLAVVETEHARLEAALAAEWEQGDNGAARAIAKQLDALCGTKTVHAYLAFCQ